MQLETHVPWHIQTIIYQWQFQFYVSETFLRCVLADTSKLPVFQSNNNIIFSVHVYCVVIETILLSYLPLWQRLGLGVCDYPHHDQNQQPLLDIQWPDMFSIKGKGKQILKKLLIWWCVIFCISSQFCEGFLLIYLYICKYCVRSTEYVPQHTLTDLQESTYYTDTIKIQCKTKQL